MVWRASARSSKPGIPVVGHIGLTPQSATALGGFKTQGKTADAGDRLVADAAKALQDTGSVHARARGGARAGRCPHHPTTSTSRRSASAPAAPATDRSSSITICSDCRKGTPAAVREAVRGPSRGEISRRARERTTCPTCGTDAFPEHRARIRDGRKEELDAIRGGGRLGEPPRLCRQRRPEHRRHRRSSTVASQRPVPQPHPCTLRDADREQRESTTRENSPIADR